MALIKASAAVIVALLFVGLPVDAREIRHARSLVSEKPKFYYGKPSLEGWTGTCETGSQQSPINIPLRKGVKGSDKKCSKGLGAVVTRSYKRTAGSVVNNGHNIQVNIVSKTLPTVKLGGRTLNLAQFHWHAHSEHTIDGEHSPLELHLVHKDSKTGALSVFGVLLKADGTTPGNHPLTVALSVAAKEEGGKAVDIDAMLQHLLPKRRANGRRPYIHYNGSLTTPPCTEAVNWYVFADRAPVTAVDVLNYHDALTESGINFGFNARPVQSLNGRKLDYCQF